MSRGIVFQALFIISILPLIALAQEPVATQVQEAETVESPRPVATLTTADILYSQEITLSANKTGKLAESKKPQAAKISTSKKDVGSAVAINQPPAVASVPEVISTVERDGPSKSGVPTEALPYVTTGNTGIDNLIKGAASRYGIDPQLMLAVMKQESSFNSRAISPKGASGLMQLMPATARRFGVRDIFDPAQNIEGGAQYLRFLLDTFNGDVELALAGYNAGENAVVRYGNRIPPYRETQDYVRKISAHYQRLKNGQVARINPSVAPSPRVSEIEIVSGIRTLTQH
ncbi:MAG TPA: lytic transglycosylase domain-containing protein [Blastocatellia bacterium]|nr:lytic transglycosylase domain-containing protein [Blastocatellia bacterium]